MGKRMGTGPVVSISPKSLYSVKRPQFATVGQAAWEFGCGAASPSPGFHPVHLSPLKKFRVMRSFAQTGLWGATLSNLKSLVPLT